MSLVQSPVGDLYQIQDALAVLAFLDAHRFLIPLLRDAAQHVREAFPQAAAFLEIFTDPESEQAQLLLVISPQCEPEDAVARYRQLRQTWWVDTLPQAQGALSIILEYR